MVRVEESVATPTGAASDTASGETLGLEPTDGSYRRGGGKPGDWVGVATVDAPAGRVTVTCTLGDASARSETAGPSGVLVAPLLATAVARVRRAARPRDSQLRP